MVLMEAPTLQRGRKEAQGMVHQAFGRRLGPLLLRFRAFGPEMQPPSHRELPIHQGATQRGYLQMTLLCASGAPKGLSFSSSNMERMDQRKVERKRLYLERHKY